MSAETNDEQMWREEQAEKEEGLDRKDDARFDEEEDKQGKGI